MTLNVSTATGTVYAVACLSKQGIFIGEMTTCMEQ